MNLVEDTAILAEKFSKPSFGLEVLHTSVNDDSLSDQPVLALHGLQGCLHAAAIKIQLPNLSTVIGLPLINLLELAAFGQKIEGF